MLGYNLFVVLQDCLNHYISAAKIGNYFITSKFSFNFLFLCTRGQPPCEHKYMRNNLHISDFIPTFAPFSPGSP